MSPRLGSAPLGAGGGSVGPGVLSSLYIFYVILRYFMLFDVNFPQASLSRPALCLRVGVGVPQPGEFAGFFFWGSLLAGLQAGPVVDLGCRIRPPGTKAVP